MLKSTDLFLDDFWPFVEVKVGNKVELTTVVKTGGFPRWGERVLFEVKDQSQTVEIVCIIFKLQMAAAANQMHHKSLHY